MTREEFVNYAAERAWEVLPPPNDLLKPELSYLLSRTVRVSGKKWSLAWSISLEHLDWLERNDMLMVEFDRMGREWQQGIRAALNGRPSNLDTAPSHV